MTNFVYDNTALSFPKTDLTPLPISANPTQWIVAQNWNELAQAAVDLRGAVRSANYLGFSPQVADPNPVAYTQSWLWVRNSDGQLIHRRADTTERELADKSSDLIPVTDNAYQLGSGTNRWLSVTGVTLISAVQSLTAGISSQNYQTYGDGQNALASALNTARVRYNNATKRIQVSHDGGIFRDILQTGDGITGSGANNQVTFWTGSSIIGGSANLTWDGTTLTVTGALTATTTITGNTNLLLTGTGNASYVQLAAGQSAAVSSVSTGRFRYNASTQKWQASENGAAYVNIVGGTGGNVAGSGANTRVAYWSAADTITSDANFTWDGTTLTIVGHESISTDLSFTGSGSASYIQMAAGSSAAVSAVSTGRIRYNESLQNFQFSLNNIAYTSLITGSGASNRITTWSGTSTQSSDANFTWDGTTQTITGHLSVSTDVLLTGSGNASFIQMAAGQSAAVSASSTGRFRYNATSNTMQLSNNTGAYNDITTSATAVTGTGVANRVATWNGTSSLTSDANFTWDGTTHTIAGHLSVSTDVLLTGSGSASFIQMAAGSSAAVSAASAGRLRYNESTQIFQISQNTAAYANLVTGSGTANRVAYWNAAQGITSDANFLWDGTTHTITGHLSVSTDVTLTGSGSASFIEMAAGTSSGNSAANRGRFRYNESTQKMQVSNNTAAYSDILTGTSGVTGSGTANQVAYWSGTSVLTSDANFTWNGTTLVVTGNETLSGNLQLTNASAVAYLQFADGHLAGGSAANTARFLYDQTGLFSTSVQKMCLSNNTGTPAPIITGLGASNGFAVFNGTTSITNAPGMSYDSANHTLSIAPVATDSLILSGGDIKFTGGFQDTYLWCNNSSANAFISGTVTGDYGFKNFDTAKTFWVQSNARIVSALSVGSLKFNVDSNGNITKINNITYSWPGSQGGVSTVLQNNGSGTLTWAAVGTTTGSGTTSQVAYWSSSSALTSSANLTFDGTLLTYTRTAVGVSTTTLGQIVTNTTAAAAGAQQYSPLVSWRGQGWKTNATAASKEVEFAWQVRPVEGTSTPTGDLILSNQIGGTGFVDIFKIDVEGSFTHLGTKLAFFGGTLATKQIRGGTTVNNVTNTASTTDTIVDITDGTTYATDFTNIRNNFFQLARIVNQLDTALRSGGYNLLT